jgi:hypothetical protein
MRDVDVCCVNEEPLPGRAPCGGRQVLVPGKTEPLQVVRKALFDAYDDVASLANS